MADTNIAWADKVWNPITGCTKCSPGCEHCYAEVMARRLKGMGQAKYKHGFKLTIHDRCLTEPLTWKKPKTIFVCSMSDLFHPDVPFAFLDKVFAVMALCQHHTFVLCTKRAERMREYLTDDACDARVVAAARAMMTELCLPKIPMIWPGTLPLSNVHLGVTVESSEQLDRTRILAGTPAAYRWVSMEPMLGETHGDAKWRLALGLGYTDGIIIGCESGPNRRPFDLAWARQVRDDCQGAGVKLYIKQLSIDGKVVTDVAKFPEDLQIRELAWPTGKR